MIVKARFLVTMDTPMIIEDGAVAVENGVIRAVGRSSDVMNRFRSEEVVVRDKHILMPGLLDCHTHTQQVLLRSSITDEMLQLPPIWTEYLIPFENRLGRDLAYLSSLLSLYLMVRSGVTFFIEAGAPYPRELVRAVREVGLKAAVTPSTFDEGCEGALDCKKALERAEETLRMAGGRVRPWCSIREIMMASRDLLEGIRDLCERYGAGLTYHLGEYQGEVDYALSKYGRRPLQVMEKLGLTRIKPSVVAHGVFFSGEEVRILEERGIGVCWCPTVDSILMAPHWLSLQQCGGRVVFGIGSDGGAFTTLDLLHEVKVARSVGKALSVSLTYSKAYPDSRTLLKALTGFQGKMIGERTGALKEGFQADMITIRIDRPWLKPVRDPVETIVCFAEAHDVNDVIVDGEFIMRDGKLTRIREEEIMQRLEREEDRIRRIVEEIRERLGRRR